MKASERDINERPHLLGVRLAAEGHTSHRSECVPTVEQRRVLDLGGVAQIGRGLTPEHACRTEQQFERCFCEKVARTHAVAVALGLFRHLPHRPKSAGASLRRERTRHVLALLGIKVKMTTLRALRQLVSRVEPSINGTARLLLHQGFLLVSRPRAIQRRGASFL